MDEVGPFPFERLPRVPAAALRPLRAVARAARARHGWRAALDALRALLGQDVQVGVVDVCWVDPRKLPELPDALVALRVELPTGVVIAELDPSTAVALVDAALGTGADADPAAFRPLRNAEMGVLSYLAARFVLAAQPAGGRILGWTTDPGALSLALRTAPRVAVRLDVGLGGHVLAARLWLPESAAVVAAAEPDPTAFRDLRVRLRAEIASVHLSAADLEQVASGDVVLLDVAHARRSSGAWTGEARVGCVGVHGTLLSGDLDPTGARITIRSVNLDQEKVHMGQKEGVRAVDVPIEVAVELGRTTLTVGELSALAPGEVVVLDRAPTDPVTLVASDRVLARGELVVVDGQVGVRIVDVVSG